MISTPIWEPTAQNIQRARITEFAKQVSSRTDQTFADYDALWRWSIAKPDEFWQHFSEFTELKFSTAPRAVLEKGATFWAASWFPGGRLNYAEQLLRYAAELGDAPALLFRSEQTSEALVSERKLTWRELVDQVQSVQQYLLGCGVTVGDRVVAYLPNCPEAVVGMLASASIGAIWSSTSPDFGLQGVLDRFGQIAPKFLFVTDGYSYNGKWFSFAERIPQLERNLASLEKIVVVSQSSSRRSESSSPKITNFNEVIGCRVDAPLTFEQLPFDHPLFILYSSGTTGAPKCIIHSAGGTLIQHLKEHQLHTDLRKGERVFYFTTCGWMMWNWLVSALATGATICLYDGCPTHPDAEVLFRLIDDFEINVFGTSAKFLSSLEQLGVAPINSSQFLSLRAVLSTGSPLFPQSFGYVYRSIKSDCCLSSISGGTDIISCFALGNPTLPVYAGEIQCRGLGMDVDVFDEEGNPTSEKGELVCKSPFPSMPIGFWNDEDGEKYQSAYFRRFPGVWTHGDWCQLTDHGGVVIFGRSDSVLNPGGVRIGTAEIYRQLEQIDFVEESVVVGQRWENDERVVLFVKLRGCDELDETHKATVRTAIRTNLTPRHVPAVILSVTAVPRTLNGKVSEIAVRNSVRGEPVKNTEALMNPEVLDQYRKRKELE